MGKYGALIIIICYIWMGIFLILTSLYLHLSLSGTLGQAKLLHDDAKRVNFRGNVKLT